MGYENPPPLSPGINGSAPPGGGLTPFLFLLLMTAALLWPVLIGGQVYYYGDFSSDHYPFKMVVARALSRGHIPLWDPSIMGGVPIPAQPLYGLAYPPTLILALLPFHAGLGAFIGSHYLLAGLFTYHLLREWEASPASSLTAALSFAFGGVMVSSLHMINILQTMTWFPMVILCFQRAMRRASGVYLTLSGLGLALMFYGGEIHLSYMALLILFLWAVVESVRNLTPAERSKGPWRPLLTFALLASVGISLSLPLLMSTGAFTSLSTRAGGLTAEGASILSLRRGGLMGLMSPSLFFDGNSYTSWYEITGEFRTNLFLSLYPGAVPLVLALVGIASAGKRFRWFFLALLLLSVLAAMGSHTPLFSLLRRAVPFMGMFRFPGKFLVPFTLFLALFTGLGAETLLRRCSLDKGRREPGESAGALLKWFLPWIVGVGLVLLYAAACREQFVALLKWMNVFDVPLSGRVESYNAYRGSVVMDLAKFGGLVVLLLLLAAAAMKTGRGRALLGPALVALTALDLFAAHHNLNATAPKEYYLRPPEVVRYLEKEKEPYRIVRLIPLVPHLGDEKHRGAAPPRPLRSGGIHLTFPSVYSVYLWEKEALEPNIGAVYGLQYGEGWSPLRLAAHRDFMELIRNSPPGRGKKLLDIYNVKYLLVLSPGKNRPLRGDGDFELAQRFDKTGLLLYRNKSYLPRVYYVPAARMVGTDEEALFALLREDFDPSREVILTTRPAAGLPRRGELPRGESEGANEPKPVPPKTAAVLRLMEYGDAGVSVSTNHSHGGYLVLSDVYYPGWRVTVDGRPAPLLRANYLFRAVELPPGKHLVRFSYTPRTFIRGSYIGLSSASITILLILVLYPRGRRRGGPG